MTLRISFAGVAIVLLASCGAAPRTEPTTTTPPSARTVQDEANDFLAFYTPMMVGLYTEMVRANWTASTDVTEEHTGLRTGADTVWGAFVGSGLVIERARTLLGHEAELDPLTVRQLRMVLENAAVAPQTNPDLARRRVAHESAQSAILDGFEFCLERRGDTCRRPITTNEIDRVLTDSDNLRDRLRYWEVSKEVGVALRPGLAELRDLRNATAREMGYPDFFAYRISNYGMTPDEMMETLDRLLSEVRPLFDALSCWARHKLAERFNHRGDVPAQIPAHWIGNRWAQAWPGLVDGVDMDALVADKEPEWIVQQAERFYVSMGMPNLPPTFWTASDLYPVPEGETRDKNDHASAWHVDLETDVRSLMSVEANWRWFGTTHHELGHIYYYLAYANPNVPPLLREGANRAFHEAIGNLIELASGQMPYLREVGLVAEGQEPDQVRALLDRALTGPIVFLPFAVGTMSHFEKALYSDDLPDEQFQSHWWELVGRYQNVAPPSERPADGCDACSKTHIINDPGEYYDYALAEVLVYQFHDHICREILQQDPHACNYYGRPEVGQYLHEILRVGATRDWREVLMSATGSELSAAPMLEYYRPLLDYLNTENGDRCGG
jgi:peptidyl-dipeptidase A